jgi:hypothetical protein
MNPKRTLQWVTGGFILFNLILLFLVLKPQGSRNPVRPPLLPSTNHTGDFLVKPGLIATSQPLTR